MDLSELGRQYELVGALLIYALGGDNAAGLASGELRSHYFQLHRARRQPDGRPALLEGHPLTDDRLAALCREVLPGLMTPSGFLDGRILAWAGRPEGPLAWWVPPGPHATFFAQETTMPSGPAPWPGLLMAAHQRALQVFALGGAERPAPETPLYHLPLPNLDRGAQVCLGDARPPARAHPRDRARWERAFFDSAFSLHHPEHAQAALLEGTWQELWRTLIRQRPEQFPVHLLRPLPRQWTVNHLLRSIGLGSTHSIS